MSDAGDGLMPLYDRALSDRDRARDRVVVLEGQVAAVRALVDEAEALGYAFVGVRELRATLKEQP
jgi:hypothetical protein